MGRDRCARCAASVAESRLDGGHRLAPACAAVAVPAYGDDRRRQIIHGLLGGVRIGICPKQFPAFLAAKGNDWEQQRTPLGILKQRLPVFDRQADSRMNPQHQSSAIQTSLPSRIPHVKYRLELGPSRAKT